jgi:hypothetical protein
MYASIYAFDDGTETTIITQLRTASSTQYPDIYLEAGDTLYASSIGSTDEINQDDLTSFGGARQISESIKELRHRDMVINDFIQNTRNSPEYTTTFQQTNSEGTNFYLNFEREQYTSIQDIPITLAAPFSLTTTQPATISRLQNLQATWIPSSDGTDTMSYQTVWFCEDAAATVGYTDPSPITDSGSINVAQPSLPDAPCAVTIVLYREKVDIESPLNSGFGLGQITKGVQRRHLTFYSVP